MVDRRGVCPAILALVVVAQKYLLAAGRGSLVVQFPGELYLDIR